MLYTHLETNCKLYSIWFTSAPHNYSKARAVQVVRLATPLPETERSVRAHKLACIHAVT